MTSIVTGQITGAASPSATSSQVTGTSPSLAVKAPCRVASTANLTLSGLQSVDGVLLAANDRVLVKDQSTASQNGIWIAQSSAWTRAVDFDGAKDAIFGTLVYVGGGDSGAHFYSVTTASGFAIGTDAVAFAIAFPRVTVSSSNPSGGSNGDLWCKVT